MTPEYVVAEVEILVYNFGNKAKGAKRMPPKKKTLTDEIEALLLSKATPEEAESLKGWGIKVGTPTKLSVVLAALYKKAAGGDLSAIKELLCHMAPGDRREKGVVFIDDIKNKAE